MGEHKPRGRAKKVMTEAVRQGERIQQDIEAKEKREPDEKDQGPMQAGTRPYPDQFPPQHLTKPGVEAELEARPMFEAPGYKGSEKLEDMVAIITGGDSGIGRAVAVLYAREGADVAIVYLNEHQDAEETKRAVEKEGRRCILISGDVSDSEFCEDAVAKTIQAFGKLDILVNNAAFQQHANHITDITDQHFDRTLKTNLYGYFYMARAAVTHMANGSAIIMTGSVTVLTHARPASPRREAGTSDPSATPPRPPVAPPRAASPRAARSRARSTARRPRRSPRPRPRWPLRFRCTDAVGSTRPAPARASPRRRRRGPRPGPRRSRRAAGRPGRATDPRR